MNGPKEHMQDFEKELSRVMRHKDAPQGIADAVLQRAEAEAQPTARVYAMPARWRTMQTWAAGAVAATLLVGFSAQHIHRERERAAATRQFEMASEIEQQALAHAREKLSRAGISLDAE